MRNSAFQSLISRFGRFRVLISLLFSGSLLVTAVAFMAFTGREVTRSTLESGDGEAQDILRVIILYLEEQKVGLDFFRDYARQRYEQQLRNLISVVVSQVDYYHTLQDKGLLSEQQAKKAALAAVEKARYGSNDYFFIYDRNNVAISHADPRIKGHQVEFANVMWQTMKERQDGFSTLGWTRLGEKQPIPKLIYYQHYPKWDWMIGTGVYIDDIERDVEKKKTEILEALRQVFSKIRVAETGYFSLFDGTGRILIHPSLANTDGNLLRDPTTGSNHIQDLIAASRTPAVPLKYFWDKPSHPGDYRYQKYSHVQYFAPFDWYVSSSVYQDEMERPAKNILQRQAVFGGGILLLSISAVCFLASRVTRSLARLEQHAARLETSDFSLPAAAKEDLLSISYPQEVANLAQTFMHVEARLDDYLDHLRETTAARQKIASELRIAHDIQMSMLPDRQRILRDQPGIELAALLEPAREVGGDLYDFFMIAPQRLCFLIGDVSDKGIPAALFMARGKAILRSAACRPDATPDTILAEANRELFEGNELKMYITVFLGILDLTSGELAFSNAGHVPPLLINASGQCSWIDVPPGKPLGIRDGANFLSRNLHLAVGDGLLVITDGVTEAQDQALNFYGEHRPLTCLRNMSSPESADGIIAGLLQDVRAFTGGSPQSDDIAMLCLRFRGQFSFSRSLKIRAGETPEQIIQTLDAAELFLKNHGLPETTVLEFRLVLEEHLTNILQHGVTQTGETVEVCVELQLTKDKILSSVSDTCPPFNPLGIEDAGLPRERRERKIGGLGLYLLRQLTDEISYQRLASRNVLRMAKQIG